MRHWVYIAILLTLCGAGFASAADTQAQDKSQDLAEAHKIHRQGYINHIKKDYDAAHELYKKAAESGLAKSELGVGRILAFDRDQHHNYKEGLPWIIRAAAPRETHQGQGFYQAQQQAKGYLDWYCRSGAAEFPKGHPFANNPKCWEGRGEALLYGRRGVRQDYAQAQLYLERAVAAGREEARAPLVKAIALNIPRKPLNRGKIAGGFAGIFLFILLMRIFRWRQKLYWLVHQLSF